FAISAGCLFPFFYPDVFCCDQFRAFLNFYVFYFVDPSGDVPFIRISTVVLVYVLARGATVSNPLY
ncbi:hypothetical protein, partial [Staphylococcus felis]|uniref:hypothetical protein n=1 Tax=Staphylococcus felis TaxID=46127 RepID=UPI0019D420AB